MYKVDSFKLEREYKQWCKRNGLPTTASAEELLLANDLNIRPLTTNEVMWLEIFIDRSWRTM